jgi:hypothetical protein
MFLSILGADTGLIGGTVGLTGVPDIQTSLTDTPTGLTGPAVPNNPILEDSLLII